MQALTSARVLAQYRGLWLVAPETDEPRLVPARGRLTETPVTGDWVELDDGGAIAAIEPRHGAIVRRDARRGDRRPGAGRQRRPRARHRAAAGPEGAPAGALRRARGVRRRAGRARADQGRPRPTTATSTAAAAGAADGRRRRGRGERASPARASASLRQLLAPGRDRGAARRLRHRQVDARQRAARRGAPGDGRGPRVRRPRPPHHGHPRAARAAGRRVPDRHARASAIAGLWDGTGETLRRRRRARAGSAASPTAATTPSRAARSASSSTPSASPPGASSSASWPGSRTAAPPPERREASGQEISLHLRRLKK